LASSCERASASSSCRLRTSPDRDCSTAGAGWLSKIPVLWAQT
jgi:hypothetical protein